MISFDRQRTLREHFTHPKGYRAILRNKRIGVFTFAWEETPEVPHNPEVVICFHPFGCAKEWLAWTSRHAISFEQHNPSSMGVALGREVWSDLIDQGGWEPWSGEQETA